MRPSRIEHIPALDGLRGVAVGAVLLFHAGHLRGGYLGVDLFFTLSGFLITSLLLAEVGGTSGVRLGSFWARRARRLLPALGVLLLGVSIYAVVFAQPDELSGIRWDAVGTLLYVANWREVFDHTSYWDIFTAPSPLQHTWSLAIEEQFYLIWPIVVFLTARRARNTSRAVAGVAAVTATLGAAWLIASYDPGRPSRAYFGTDTRIASILFGAALAALFSWRPGWKTPSRGVGVALQVVGVVGAAVIAWEWWSLDGQRDLLYRGGLLFVAMGATAVIAAIATDQSGFLARLLALPPLRWIGLISYGVYLYHWPIYAVITPQRMHGDGWSLTATRIGVTLAVATASYFVIERPIRRGAGSPRVMWIVGSAAAALALVVVVAATAGGHPLIDPADGRAEETAAAARRASRSPEGTHRLMLAGSSIAANLAEPLRATRDQAHLIVLNRAVVGCAFPDGVTRRLFHDKPAEPYLAKPCGQTWSRDVATFRPEAVLYIPGSEPGDVAVEVDGRFLKPCSREYNAVYRASLLRHVKDLSRQGTIVYLATFAYAGYPFLSDEWYRNTDCVNNIIRSVAATTPGAALVDLARHVCPTRRCMFGHNGKAIRPDSVHYHGPGATAIAEWIRAQMLLTKASTR